MTPEDYKRLLPIVQAGAEGREIECRPRNVWNNAEHWEAVRGDVLDLKLEYRVKPATYRVWLSSTGGPRVWVWGECDIAQSAVERLSYFIRWLGPEQEYEA